MASQVIKKDGSRESFDVSKIERAIRAAASLTELSEERVEEVVREVSAVVVKVAEEKETITSYEIRDVLLGKLDRIEPAVSEVWRQYRKNKE